MTHNESTICLCGFIYINACARKVFGIDGQTIYVRSPGYEHKCIVTKNWRNTNISQRKEERKMGDNNDKICVTDEMNLPNYVVIW